MFRVESVHDIPFFVFCDKFTHEQQRIWAVDLVWVRARHLRVCRQKCFGFWSQSDLWRRNQRRPQVRKLYELLFHALFQCIFLWVRLIQL